MSSRRSSAVCCGCLLGELDESALTSLGAFGGLQSYPSRTKDPDPVDYSTGSVGIGATAPAGTGGRWSRPRVRDGPGAALRGLAGARRTLPGRELGPRSG